MVDKLKISIQIDIESYKSRRETGRQKIKDGGSINGRADNNEKEMVKIQQWAI